MIRVKCFILSVILCFPALGKENNVLNIFTGEGAKMNNINLTEYDVLLSKNELNWNPVLEKKVQHNNKDAILYRFEPANSVSLSKTNYSILINLDDGSLLGISRLLLEYKKGNVTQVSKDKAEKTMIKFIDKFSPVLLENYKVQWISEHDEQIYLGNDKITVSGMKVKCRDLNTGLYFWVIVAPDNSIMVFEKEIEWDFLRAGRKTQKWLHDSYIKDKGIL